MTHGRILEGLQGQDAGAMDRGMPSREAVETFGVSLSLATLKRWLTESREVDDLSPRYSAGRKRHILATF